MKKIIGICGWKGSGKDTISDYFIKNYGYKKDSFAKSLKDMASSIFNWDRDLLEGITEESRIWRETPDIFWETRLDWKNHIGYKLSERFTPRFALQYLGTQLFRENFHYNLWVFSMESRLINSDKIIIPDVRFQNEIEMIKNLGGVMIWVQRGALPEWYECAVKANTFPYKGCDIIFENPTVNYGLLFNETVIKNLDKHFEKVGTNSKDYGTYMMNQKYKIHESEWQWVGHNFDYVIENNGTISDLYKKIEALNFNY